MHRHCTQLLVLALTAGLVSIPIAAEDVTAESVMKAHVEAVGGVDNIKKVTSLKRSGSATMDGVFGHLEGTFEEMFIIGKKAFTSLDMTAFQQRAAWDGATGWADDPMQGVRDMEDGDLELLKTQAQVDFLASLWIRYGPGAFILGPAETDEGKTFHSIKIVDAEEATHYIDSSDHQLSRIVLPFSDPQLGESTMVISLSEFTEHQGVKLPDKVSVDIADGTIVIEYDYSDTQINAEIDEAVFNRP